MDVLRVDEIDGQFLVERVIVFLMKLKFKQQISLYIKS